MYRTALRWLAGILLAALLVSIPAVVKAHETITAGEYSLEYGWLDEPPVAGQPNAVVLEIGHGHDGALAPDEAAGLDLSGLKVELAYAGQAQALALEPVGEDAPGEYRARVTPALAGEYALRFSGQLAGAGVQAEAHLEEVLPADAYLFPQVEAGAAQAGSALDVSGWLGIAGIALGLIGSGLGLAALRRRGA